jgi:hypothetical protein
VAIATGVPARPFRCDSLEVGQCPQHGFVSLAECLEACDSQLTGLETACAQNGTIRACDPSLLAERAQIELSSPFGSFASTHAWLTRTRGFLDGVGVVFTANADPILDSKPLFSLSLFDGQDAESLVGRHITGGMLSLCDGYLSLPIEVTITQDELTLERQPDLSERFAGSFQALGDDVELRGEFDFEHVCEYSTSD